MNAAMGRIKNTQAYQSHSIPLPFNIPCSCSVHLFVHLLKWEKKHSCTDENKPKKEKKNPFLAEQKCAVKYLALENAVVNVERACLYVW